MDTKDEALKMAIEGYEECLENLQGWAAYASEYFQDKWDLEGEVKDHKDKINACKEALEQPAQEPYKCHWVEKGKGHCERNNRMGLPDVYTYPTPQPAQEPVAWVWVMEHEGAYRIFATEEQANEFMCGYAPAVSGDVIVIRRKVYGYTHPHQWQGLTDDEIAKIKEDYFGSDFINFARAIEKSLKEKNS